MFVNRSKIMTRDVLNTISLKARQSINNDRHNHGVYCLLHLTWADLATLHWIWVIDRFRSFYTDLIHSSVSSNNQLLANSLSHLPSQLIRHIIDLFLNSRKAFKLCKQQVSSNNQLLANRL